MATVNVDDLDQILVRLHIAPGGVREGIDKKVAAATMKGIPKEPRPLSNDVGLSLPSGSCGRRECVPEIFDSCGTSVAPASMESGLRNKMMPKRDQINVATIKSQNLAGAADFFILQ